MTYEPFEAILILKDYIADWTFQDVCQIRSIELTEEAYNSVNSAFRDRERYIDPTDPRPHVICHGVKLVKEVL